MLSSSAIVWWTLFTLDHLYSVATSIPRKDVVARIKFLEA